VMGKRIVAEFVETEALADALRDIGVDYAQGFGIAPPKAFTADFESVTKTTGRPRDHYERLTA
jgi:EAL domain-containing protein (putative c-di-GMP-specific phosphodiesterase class I)